MDMSFYGGRQGISFKIVKNYENFAKMEADFQNNPGDVGYGEYVLITSPLRSFRNTENGSLYRRGISGPEYVGRISGPAGPSPQVRITDYDNLVTFKTDEKGNLTKEENAETKTFEGKEILDRKTSWYDYGIDQDLIPGMEKIEGKTEPDYNDTISAAMQSVRVVFQKNSQGYYIIEEKTEDGTKIYLAEGFNQDGTPINKVEPTSDSDKIVSQEIEETVVLFGMKIPYHVFEFEAKSIGPYEENRKKQEDKFTNPPEYIELVDRVDDLTHPFYSKWDIKVPHGIKGDSISNVRVTNQPIYYESGYYGTDPITINVTAVETQIHNIQPSITIDGKTFYTVKASVKTRETLDISESFICMTAEVQNGSNSYIGQKILIQRIDSNNIDIYFTQNKGEIQSNSTLILSGQSKKRFSSNIYNLPKDYRLGQSILIGDIHNYDIKSPEEGGTVTTYFLSYFDDINNIHIDEEGTVTIDYTGDNNTQTFEKLIRWSKQIEMNNKINNSESGVITVTYNHENGEASPLTQDIGQLTWLTDTELTNDGLLNVTYNHTNKSLLPSEANENGVHNLGQLTWLTGFEINNEYDIIATFNNDKIDNKKIHNLGKVKSDHPVAIGETFTFIDLGFAEGVTPTIEEIEVVLNKKDRLDEDPLKYLESGHLIDPITKQKIFGYLAAIGNSNEDKLLFSYVIWRSLDENGDVVENSAWKYISTAVSSSIIIGNEQQLTNLNQGQVGLVLTNAPALYKWPETVTISLEDEILTLEYEEE